MRDNDKAKVYEAENQVAQMLDRRGRTVTLYGSEVAVPDERKFCRVEDVQRYVDAVLAHIDCPLPIKVRARRGQKSAHYEPVKCVIAVPDKTTWALRELVILHEIAHHLAGRGAAHGPEFRSQLAELLERVLAPEARFMLQVAYGERGLSA